MVRAFYGNFLVVVRALCYCLTLGPEGLCRPPHMAVLNANYVRVRLSEAYKMAYEETCMHEFVMTLQPEKGDNGNYRGGCGKGAS